MTEKTELFDYAISILELKGIEYYHIPNNAFRGRYKSKNLKHQPDLMFTYKNKFFLREYGIEGRHRDRKEKQLAKMKRWFTQAPDITDYKLIFSRAALIGDFLEIGLV